MLMSKEIKERIRKLKKERILPPPPVVNVPVNTGDVRADLTAIQSFISSFEYNYSGTSFVPLKKSRSLLYVYKIAQDIIRIGLPIQCVEATFLGCHLTAGMKDIDRVPLSFKSKCQGSIHRHMVLAIRYGNKWGALGISRRSDLMYKDLKYLSLAELILDFEQAYKKSFHNLMTAYVGLPFSHDRSTDNPVKWRAQKIHVHQNERKNIESVLATYSNAMLGMLDIYISTGKIDMKSDSELSTHSEIPAE